MNKFLKKYPQLRQLKPGDKVKVINTDCSGDRFFNVGDIGIVVKEEKLFNNELCIMVDFSTYTPNVLDNGVWWAMPSELKYCDE